MAPGISVAWGGTGIADGENSPSGNNGTDFGSITQGASPVVRAFTIVNTGTATLTLGSLSLPAGFSVVPSEGLPSSIAAGNSAIFEVQLNTSSVGTYSGQISFGDNVTNENPFTFEVTGTVNAPTTTPGISVAWGGNGIADGENSPSSSNGTDFGSITQGGPPVVRAFTIVNTGTATLTLGSLSLPTGFSVVPSEGLPSSIAAGNSAIFEVQLNTSSVGTYSGQISFNDNVTNESPFNFEVTGTVNAPSPPPSVTATNQTVNNGATVPITNIYSVTGSGITEYQIWFSAANQGAPALGSVKENGTAILLNQAVTETSLTGLTYTGGATPGTDEMWLRAYNGTWSGWAQANITDPGAVTPATVTANNPTVANGQMVTVSPTIFSVSGSGISEYEVWFSAANQGAPALGSVTNNGSAIALNQGVFLTSLSGLDYTGGATAGTDEMWLRAYNGTWSGWAQANITDPGAVTPATVTANNPTVANGQMVTVSPTIFSVSGSGISEYEVWFSAANQGAPALGSVTNSGSAIALNQGVFLSSLSGLDYTGGATPGTDEMWLRAYNGTWSGWVQANITDPGAVTPATVTANNPTVANGQMVTVSPTIFTVSGSGISEYEVWFSAANQGAPALGSVTNSGSAIALNQGVFLTSLNGLDYTGGATPGTDEMWLRAYNGTWSGWVQANITDPGAVTPATVTANNPTVANGQMVTVSPTIFSVSGSGISEYEVWFSAANQGAPALGSVTNNGSAIALNQGVFLSSLSGLNYTGGATAGADEMWLRAYDGNWSSWVQANITDTGASHAPEAQTVLAPAFAPYQSAADFVDLPAALQGPGSQDTWDSFGAGQFAGAGAWQVPPMQNFLEPTSGFSSAAAQLTPSDSTGIAGSLTVGVNTLQHMG